MRGKWLKTIFSIMIVIALFFCIAMTNRKPREVTLMESILGRIILFPQKAYTYAKAYVTSDDGFFIEVDKVKEENEELKQKIIELESKMIDYEELSAENSILKEYVNMADTYPNYHLVIGDIISDSATNWEATYIINRGSKDGVEKGMAVIAENGLVGYVSEVSKSTSKIVSILDAGNSVSSRVVRTRNELVLKGSISSEKQELKVIHIPSGVTLIEGDKMETSGVGGIYPKGIPIGRVTQIVNKKNPMENEAIISPNVDFEKLETVAVIISNVEGTDS
ncbi:MAG: rod shape-determining protein MreC [Clostridia bacterium]|nr:rod shape-determining protein MreC [Clostridia bacterium]